MTTCEAEVLRSSNDVTAFSGVGGVDTAERSESERKYPNSEADKALSEW